MLHRSTGGRGAVRENDCGSREQRKVKSDSSTLKLGPENTGNPLIKITKVSFWPDNALRIFMYWALVCVNFYSFFSE